MTGHNWTGREHRFTAAPGEYGAIHFHDDDLDDARLGRRLPARRPGRPAERRLRGQAQRGGAHEDYVPFYVRPPRGRATARVGLLVPTNSYLAYANDNVAVDDAIAGARDGPDRDPQPPRAAPQRASRVRRVALRPPQRRRAAPATRSWRRPILTMRPKYRHTYARAWQFTADLHLVDWLDAKGIDVDVFTDEDLHREGADLLRRYRAVLTGSHPEYCSARHAGRHLGVPRRRRAARVPRRQRLLLGRRVPPRAAAHARDPSLGRDRATGPPTRASATSA